jgi:hypothetical protein
VVPLISDRKNQHVSTFHIDIRSFVRLWDSPKFGALLLVAMEGRSCSHNTTSFPKGHFLPTLLLKTSGSARFGV